MRRCTLTVAALSCALFTACGDDGGSSSGPVRVAMLSPSSGPLAGVGMSFDRVATVAVASINDLGGIDGRDLELIITDTTADPATARAELIRLITEEGIVAAVGPATSGEVDESYEIAAEHRVPIISPSSTAPFLSETSILDDGYMFRNVPDDDVQGLAIAHYLYNLEGVTTAAVVYEDTGYGEGLKDAFKVAFENLGGVVSDEVAFIQDLADVTAAAAVINDLASADPDPAIVVTVALEGDAILLTQAWDNGGTPLIAGMEFFLTDGARSQTFLDESPASITGMCGSAPTYPTEGDAYSILKEAYEAEYDDVLEAQVYAPNVWDGFHLIAGGLVSQANEFPGDELGGANLRDAIDNFSRDGQTMHAGDWRNIIGNLQDGNDIDYDGAAGPNNFDVVGQTIGPYEVWCVEAGTPRTFSQALFLDADDIAMLLE